MNAVAPQSPNTFHAPPERLPADEVLRQSAAMQDLGGLAALLDCMPDWVMILNEQRQIIFGNKALRDLARALACEPFIGLRPGEMLGCRQALAAPSGCGTGEACRTCGAVTAILAALAGHSVMHECRVANVAADSHDLRIWASPFLWNGAHYALIIAVDISDEKRRQVLERIFFHDILNTAGNIQGLSELIRCDPGSVDELKDDLYESAESLVNEIRSQRMLLAAEQHELQVTLAPTDPRELLEAVAQTYRHHSMAKGKHIAIVAEPAAAVFSTDETLMQRVLGNLLKNALEAGQPGDVVELGTVLQHDRRVFWCHNAQPIPRALQLQMFQRSFSTKGPGRGVGTYSIKLLTERYLGGQVTLQSTPETGTRFELSFPQPA